MKKYKIKTYGVIGVPVTFIKKYNKNQFIILGKTQNNNIYNLKTKEYSPDECILSYFQKFNKKGIYDLNRAPCIIINNQPEPLFERMFIKPRGDNNEKI